jgi:hypothetical protein
VATLEAASLRAWRACPGVIGIRAAGLVVHTVDSTKGTGLVATLPIAAGTIVCCYSGVCSTTPPRPRRSRDAWYEFTVSYRGATWYVDATNGNRSDVGRYVNHSMRDVNVVVRVEPDPRDIGMFAFFFVCLAMRRCINCIALRSVGCLFSDVMLMM